MFWIPSQMIKQKYLKVSNILAYYNTWIKKVYNTCHWGQFKKNLIPVNLFIQLFNLSSLHICPFWILSEMIKQKYLKVSNTLAYYTTRLKKYVQVGPT